jgi:hypothetical protein
LDIGIPEINHEYLGYSEFPGIFQLYFGNMKSPGNIPLIFGNMKSPGNIPLIFGKYEIPVNIPPISHIVLFQFPGLGGCKKTSADGLDEGGGEVGHAADPTLRRTGRLFGGLVADVRRKLPWLRVWEFIIFWELKIFFKEFIKKKLFFNFYLFFKLYFILSLFSIIHFNFSPTTRTPSTCNLWRPHASCTCIVFALIKK